MSLSICKYICKDSSSLHETTNHSRSMAKGPPARLRKWALFMRLLVMRYEESSVPIWMEALPRMPLRYSVQALESSVCFSLYFW